MKSFKKLILSSLLSTTVLTAVSPVVSAETLPFIHSSESTQAESADQTIGEKTRAANETRANDPAYLEDTLTKNDGFEFDDEGNIISITIGGETVEVTKENPAETDVPVNNTPNRITTNVTKTPADSMHVQWHTTDADEDARLYVWKDGESIEEAVDFVPEIIEIDDAFYAQTTEDGYYVYAIMWDEEEDKPFTKDKKDPWIATDNPDKVLGYYTDEGFSEDNLAWLDKGFDNYSLILPYPKFSETAYKATATDLDSDTIYHYAVGNKDGELSEEATFTTAAEENDEFTFIHYTDTQNAHTSEHQRSEADYSASTVKSMLENDDAKDADFALHTGDIVNDDWNDTEWNLTLDALLPLNNQMPHLYVTGNHDNENFLDHINTDNEVEGMESGAAYSTRYNGAQFIVLNTENNKDSDDDKAPAILDDQMKWFEEELKSATKAKEDGEIDWIFVTYHRPLFSASYHSLEDEAVQVVRDDLMKLIDEYDVDAVFNGHDHNMTVTHALKYDGDVFGNAEVATEGTIEGDTTTYSKPEGTVFFIPNNAGTKTYDTIYKNQTFDWILEEEDIDVTYKELFDYEVTEEDINSFRELFVTEEQPFLSSFYKGGHSNARESNIQNYGVVDVTKDKVTYKMYEVVGEDLANRETNLVHTFVIEK